MSDLGTIPSSAACADACVQLGVELRVAPPELSALDPAWHLCGPAVPVRHLGSVDAFLAACEDLAEGSVLVIDDDGRRDRACIGDLTALEVKGAGGAGMVVWGCHRDTAQLLDVGLPVFSLGHLPNGPLGVDPPDERPVRLGEHVVLDGDVVVADADGALLLSADRADEVIRSALDISKAEGAQALAARDGRSLRDQLDFGGYLRQRELDPDYTLREHLRRRGGAIER